ncbi:right-handed parallel beta-helix repeat-containing protein [Frigidibacter sp. MR17.24]|uniref:right-handed parallel beta-helix repeat-containing protein n=1 Tax=Frigidibacter sp. MR17.24 TaxID=3127345 RepID=UPI003013025B
MSSTTTIQVSTAAELQTALANCTGGETILLAQGDYGSFTVPRGYGTGFSSAVTIASADPETPAVFSGMRFADAANLTFDGLTFDYTFQEGDKEYTQPFAVFGSSNITIANSTFDGDVASGISTAADGYGSGWGLRISGGDNITLSNNEISGFMRGIVAADATNLTFSDNDIHDLRMDGMNFSAVQGVVIENNYIHDFAGSPTSGDHCDMIQFWTNGTTVPNTDIVIRGNVLDIGDGTKTQGIFMRNEEVDLGRAGTEMYYQNVVIEQNTIYNSMVNGIALGAATGVLISDNTLLQVTGSDGVVAKPTLGTSALSTDVTITGNLTTGLSSTQPGWTVADNLVVQNTSSNAANYYGEVFLTSSLEAGATGAHGFVLQDGYAGFGSDLVQKDLLTTATALFEVTKDAGDSYRLVFDASASVGEGGAALPENATYIWTFGDGTTATGKVVSHAYGTIGNYDVSLQVLVGNATLDTATLALASPDTTVLRLDTASGLLVKGSAAVDDMALRASLADGEAIHLAGTGMPAKSSVAELQTLVGADDFTLDFTLQATAAQANGGHLFRLSNSFTAYVTPAGALSFTLTTADGQVSKVGSVGMSFLDGGAHSVSLAYDGDAGTLSLHVDGVDMGSVSAGDGLSAPYSSGLYFGNPWGQTNFSGDILDFSLSTNDIGYEDYAGTVPQTEALPIWAVQPIEAAPSFEAIEAAPVEVAPVFDDYHLDLAAFTGKLSGNVALETGADGKLAIDFDGGSKAVADLGRLTQFEQSEHLAVSLDYSRDTADGSYQRLLWNHMKMGIEVINDGLYFRIATSEGFTQYRLNDLGLNDTDNHNISVYADAETDELQLYVDGTLVLHDTTKDIDFVGAGGREWGWMIGTPWNGNFDGKVSGLAIDDDMPMPQLTDHLA